VNRPGHQFLAGAALARHETGAAADGDLGQNGEQVPHAVILADDIGEGVLPGQFLPQFGDEGQIAEYLDTAADRPVLVTQDASGDADGDPPAGGVDDVDGLADYRLSGVERTAQGAIRFADAGAKDITTGAADGLLAADTGDLFGSTVEGGDTPVLVDSEDTVGRGVENGGGVLQVELVVVVDLEFVVHPWFLSSATDST